MSNIGKIISKQGGTDNVMCNCGSRAEKGFTTNVTDLGNCLIIIRNVPCYKCTQCNEVTYTGDVVKKIEEIIEHCRKMMQEVSIIDYSKVA